MMIKKSTFDFLKSLRKNNNREWFADHKNLYDAALSNMHEFVQKLIEELSRNDKSLKGLESKDCLFRIYRDVRFSKNKEPYKTNFGSVLAPGGRKSDRACFYIQVEPGNSFVAGGRWMPSPEDLKEIRSEIFYNPGVFKKILGRTDFKKHFSALADIKLKLPPKGFDKNFKDAELLKYTSYIVEHPLSDSRLMSKNIFADCSRLHRSMLPLLNFLNRATH